MRQAIALIIIIMSTGLQAATPYSVTATRAARAYAAGEWANASALYLLMLDEEPDSAETYSRAIVASAMMQDSAMTVDLLERAMAHAIAIDTVLTDVRQSAFLIGQADIYHDFLLRLRQAKPYIRRAIDTRLLDYYLFRNDGEKIIEYSQMMLQGLPDKIQYLENLAHGYLLTGRNDEALATWGKILTQDPDNFDALVNIAGLYLTTDRPQEALPYLRHAHQINPTPYIAAQIDSLTRGPKP